MLQEAIAAIQNGNRARARDLLTRLLKNGQDNPEYWIWMSAVVETAKERSFCLNQVLKLDPENPAARRGLAMMGAAPVDESQVIPFRLQRRNWQSKLQGDDGVTRKAPPWYLLALMGVAVLVVVGLGIFALLGEFQTKAEPTRVTFRRPTETQTIAVTPSRVITQTGTIGPTPLVMLLDATYTPTPLYVNTPHPQVEAYRIGIRAFGRGDWESVRRYMVEVLTAEPGAADVQYYIAESYRMQQNYAEAIRSYSRALEINPNFAPAFLGRARAILGRNARDIANAKADLEKAIARDGNYGEAYLELGLLFIRANEPENAINILQSVEPLIPYSPQLYLYLGMAYQLSGNSEKALEMAYKAKDLDMTMLPAYRLIGESLQSLDDLKGSLDPLYTYTRFETQDAQAWLWYARALYADGNIDEALKSFDVVLRINPQMVDALIQRGTIYLDLQDGDKALDDFRAAVRLQADSFEANVGIAQALMLLGFPGDAYMQLERTSGLAKSDEQKAELYYWRGLSLEALNELTPALRTWNALLDLPEEIVPADRAQYARERIQAIMILTPSPTASFTVTSTQTRVPTATPRPTQTPRPSFTPTVTRTVEPTRTPLPTDTRVPSRTPTP